MNPDEASKYDDMTLQKQVSASLSDLEVQAQIRVDVTQSPLKVVSKKKAVMGSTLNMDYDTELVVPISRLSNEKLAIYSRRNSIEFMNGHNSNEDIKSIASSLNVVLKQK